VLDMVRNTSAAQMQRLGFTRSMVRFGYLPTMLIGVNALGIWLASNDSPTPVMLGALLAAVALSCAAERVLPYERPWNRDRGDTRRDIVHAAVNESLQVASLLLLPIVVGWIAIDGLWPRSWPFAAQVLVALLILDAGITFGHYASHRLSVLWRFHAVHHSVERFYGFNGLMKHPLHQLFETAVATTPLVLLGLPASVAAALVFCVAVQLLLQHANVGYAVGPAGPVLALNHLHRYSSDIGIATRPDFPVTYVAQLADPFRHPGAVATIADAAVRRDVRPATEEP